MPLMNSSLLNSHMVAALKCQLSTSMTRSSGLTCSPRHIDFEHLKRGCRMQTSHLIMLPSSEGNETLKKLGYWRSSRKATALWRKETCIKQCALNVANLHLEVFAKEADTLCQHHVRVWILVAPEQLLQSILGGVRGCWHLHRRLGRRVIVDLYGCLNAPLCRLQLRLHLRRLLQLGKPS